MAVVNVIVIHGIGAMRGPDAVYSLPLQRNIRRYFGIDDPEALRFYEVNWSDIGDPEQNRLIRDLGVIPPARWPSPTSSLRHALGDVGDKLLHVSSDLRRFLFTSVGDTLIYQTERGRREIQGRLLSTILEVRQALGATDRNRPRYVSIIAHSLGSVVSYDVAALLGGPLRSEVVGLGLSHFFTLGSPLALYSLLEYHDAKDAHYRSRGIYLDRPDGRGSWLNFYDQQDVVACLLEQVYPPQPNVPGRSYRIEDIRVETGTFHAHVSYWRSKQVAEAIAAKLRDDYEHDRG